MIRTYFFELDKGYFSFHFGFVEGTAPPIIATSSSDSVTYDYSPSIQIEPFSVSPAIYTSITCVQLSPIIPDICSQGSFNVLTK